MNSHFTKDKSEGKKRDSIFFHEYALNQSQNNVML